MKMEKLSNFVQTNKKSIHKLLNRMWYTVVYTRKQLLKTNYKVGKMECAKSGYTLIGEKWRRMWYPYPAFRWEYGEIGCTLDGLFVTFYLEGKTINEKFIDVLIKNFGEQVVIYGGKEFLTDFWNPKRGITPKAREILSNIEKSKEKIVQMDLTFEPWDDIVDRLASTLIISIDTVLKFAFNNKVKLIMLE